MWLKQDDESPSATERRGSKTNIERENDELGSDLAEDVKIKKGLENNVSSPAQKEPDGAWVLAKLSSLISSSALFPRRA